MRILIIASFYFPELTGGAEHSLKVLAEGLVSKGHEVRVVVSKTKDGIVSRDLSGGVAVHRILDCDRSFMDATAAGQSKWRKLRRFISSIYRQSNLTQVQGAVDDFNPDILQFHNLHSLSSAVWRAKTTAVKVQVLHDYYLCCRSGRMSGGEICEGNCAKCGVVQLARRPFASSLSAIIGNSAYTLKVYSKSFLFPKRVLKMVIYSPVRSLDAIPASPDRVNSKGTKYRIGFIGRLDPTKGIETILTAARGGQLDAFTFVVAGEGDDNYVAQLKSNAPANVSFVGRVNPNEFMPTLDGLVVPSLWPEPMGRVVLEAYQHGLPVVASGVGGLTELVKNGTSGLLFPAGDAGKLTDALLHLPKMMTEETGRFNRELVKAFTDREILLQWEELYAELLRNPGAIKGHPI